MAMSKDPYNEYLNAYAAARSGAIVGEERALSSWPVDILAARALAIHDGKQGDDPRTRAHVIREIGRLTAETQP